jgi:hypothetical protein
MKIISDRTPRAKALPGASAAAVARSGSRLTGEFNKRVVDYGSFEEDDAQDTSLLLKARHVFASFPQTNTKLRTLCPKSAPTKATHALHVPNKASQIVSGEFLGFTFESRKNGATSCKMVRLREIDLC